MPNSLKSWNSNSAERRAGKKDCGDRKTTS